MNTQQNEATLATRRLHWGIFAAPLLTAVLLGLLMLLVVFLFHLMRNMVAQLNPQATSPFGGWILIMLLFPMAVNVLPLLVVTLVAYLKSEITLTKRRLVYKTGLFARVSGELPLDNIEAIVLAEPILGRILGYGTVIVTTLGGLRLPFRYIVSATEFHATLQSAVRTAKTKPTASAGSPAPIPNDHSRFMPKS